METKNRVVSGLILSASIFIAPAQATLIDNGDGTVSDTRTGLMWLKDANYAKTSGYDTDGLMDWYQAMSWANNLNYAGYDDWRLPVTVQPDASCALHYDAGAGYPLQGYDFGCTGSEMGDLFRNALGGIFSRSVSESPLLSGSDPIFENVQESKGYWSSTEFAPDNDFAWGFNFFGGSQYFDEDKKLSYYAWAVRSGGVVNAGPGGAPVPEPGTGLLLGLGLAGIGWARRGRGRRRW